MDNGFIILHRKITENPIWQDSELSHLFVHLLLVANHERKRVLRKGQEMWIERGQLKTGQHMLAMQTGIPAGSIWRKLQTLQNLGIVSIKPSSKFSIITIEKYDDYQSLEKRLSRKVSSKRVASEEQVSTNNNETTKQSNSDTIVSELESTPSQQAKAFFASKENQEVVVRNLMAKGMSEQLVRFEISKFCNYWTELNKLGTKQRWQLQETFELPKRLATWFNKKQEFNTASKKGSRIYKA